MEGELVNRLVEYAPAVALMSLVVWKLLGQQDRLVDQVIHISTLCAGICDDDDDDDGHSNT